MNFTGGPGMTSEQVMVPDNMVGLIIGRGGEQITKLQAESGCKIQMAQDSQGLPHRLCTLTGTAESISIARRLQDPLVEFSQLCGTEKDILCLRFHPMQEVVGEDQLLEAINLQFINRVNEVGVNINDCAMYNHKSNLVQFVGGE